LRFSTSSKKRATMLRTCSLECKWKELACELGIPGSLLTAYCSEDAGLAKVISLETISG
jgi:hypothetical protein